MVIEGMRPGEERMVLVAREDWEILSIDLGRSRSQGLSNPKAFHACCYQNGTGLD